MQPRRKARTGVGHGTVRRRWIGLRLALRLALRLGLRLRLGLGLRLGLRLPGAREGPRRRSPQTTATRGLRTQAPERRHGRHRPPRRSARGLGPAIRASREDSRSVSGPPPVSGETCATRPKGRSIKNHTWELPDSCPKDRNSGSLERDKGGRPAGRPPSPGCPSSSSIGGSGRSGAGLSAPGPGTRSGTCHRGSWRRPRTWRPP